MNQIGDEGVRLLLPVLEARTNIKAFRVTHRVSRETAKVFHAMMIKRCVKAKKKKVSSDVLRRAPSFPACKPFFSCFFQRFEGARADVVWLSYNCRAGRASAF